MVILSFTVGKPRARQVSEERVRDLTAFSRHKRLVKARCSTDIGNQHHGDGGLRRRLGLRLARGSGSFLLLWVRTVTRKVANLVAVEALHLGGSALAVATFSFPLLLFLLAFPFAVFALLSLLSFSFGVFALLSLALVEGGKGVLVPKTLCVLRFFLIADEAQV